MTDLDAAAYLRELQEYNRQGSMRTPANPNGPDTFFDCAIDHAIRALTERAGVEVWEWNRNPNGSYDPVTVK